MYTIEINDDGVTQSLKRLSQQVDNLSPAMREIGEYLIESTKRRFATGTDPDGKAWAPNSVTTIEAMLGRSSRAGKRPLIGESKRLGTEIMARPTADSVSVGSSLLYAAVQQFGAGKGEFGATRRGAPIPWGDIPARPYLGISDEDRGNVMDIISEYLEDAMK